VPDKCPTCGGDIDETPVNLEHPFIKANQHPSSVILRPSGNVTFLDDFKDHSSLHIAVTNSKGDLIEYDEAGLVWTVRKDIDLNLWSQCILVESVEEGWTEFWDEKLLEICQDRATWTAVNYNETAFNCLSFVLAFMKSLNHKRLSNSWLDKEDFCEKFIIPKTKLAAKFITLYRKIDNSAVVIENCKNNFE
jgi:hypothetical protein